MNFKFHELHDAQSIQKRYQEKEARRLRRNHQKTQESSRVLQDRFNISCRTPQLPQSHDAHLVAPYDVNGSFPPEGSEQPLVDTTLETAESNNLTMPTASNHVDEHGVVLSSAPVGWGVGIGAGNGHISVDPWLSTLPNQSEAGDMLPWSFGNASAMYSRLSNTYDRPGIAHLPLMPLGWAASRLAAPIAPSQHPDDSATGVSAGEAYLLDPGDGLVALAQPSEPAVSWLSTQSTEDAAGCMGPRAQSEATTIVIASPRDPPPSRMEVLIEANPPQDTAQDTTIPDYPTPSTDDCQTAQKPAKGAFGGKKRALNTAHSGIDTPREIRDGDHGGNGGLRRSKRHCDGTKINYSLNNIPPADIDRLPARTVKPDDAQHGHLPSGENQVRNTTVSRLRQAPSRRPRARAPANDCGRSRDLTPDPRRSNAASVEPLLADLHGTQSQACTSCGVDRAHLLRLSQNILHWANPPDSAPFEAALLSGRPLSARDNEAIILRLSIGSLRDYILAPRADDGDPTGQQSHFPRPLQAPKTIADDDLPGTVLLAPSFPASDLGNGSDSSHKPIEDSDNESETIDTSVHKSRGQRGRWSPRDEALLRAYVLEDLSWSEIAARLKRSESGVQQHWRIMTPK